MIQIFGKECKALSSFVGTFVVADKRQKTFSGVQTNMKTASKAKDGKLNICSNQE